MTGLSVLVVDDEPLARRRAIRLLKQLVNGAPIEEAGNVEEARAILDAQNVDVLLLDIQMPGGSGFDLLETLSNPPKAIVFITAFDHHALRAFDAQAIDYITKPIDPGRLRAAFTRAIDTVRAQTNQDRIAELQEAVKALRQAAPGSARFLTEFWIRLKGDYLRVPATHVIRFQADRDYVRIHVAAESYLYHESLASLEKRLDPDQFVRVHRSTILRRDAIIRIKTAPFSSLIAMMGDGSEFRVGRTYASKIRAGMVQTALSG